jgi:catechol 2,3-dioxygenase-like lactoylglutathione lyase family enzyme
MSATGFTHASVHVHDLEESARLYKELFGMENIPTPDFTSFSVRWLRVGGLQLHLIQREEAAPPSHHVGMDVDDFEVAYLKAKELDVRVKEGYFSNLYELPDGAVQMYVRDPAGNMMEVNWPEASTLDRSVVTEEIHKVPAETNEAAKATLYLWKQRV